MVLGYWDRHGYPNFPNDYQHDLIDELADAMGTWSGWPADGTTLPIFIDDGINKVCRNHGYSDWASNKYFPSWSDMMEEINAHRPFVLSMLHGGTGSGHVAAVQHSVAVVGYMIIYGNGSDSERYLMLQDTWDKYTHYLAFGDCWRMATWVRPE